MFVVRMRVKCRQALRDLESLSRVLAYVPILRVRRIGLGKDRQHVHSVF